MRKLVIAIDGHSACGKSSTAIQLAKILNYAYIDTGAMYRAVTYYFLENHVSITNPADVDKALRKILIDFRRNERTKVNETFLNGVCVEEEIRSMRVSENVSAVSAVAKVREDMVAQQRKMGKNKRVVMDGRDIGTVVFPDADLKIFMTANYETRAFRRQKELLNKGKMVPFEEVLSNLKSRDEADSTRKESPLRKSADAIDVDTTNLFFDEQLEVIVQIALGKILEDEG